MLSFLLLAATAGGAAPRQLTDADFRGNSAQLDQDIMSMIGGSFGRTGNLPERFSVTCDVADAGRVANCTSADGSNEGRLFANGFARWARLKPGVTGRVRYTSRKITY